MTHDVRRATALLVIDPYNDFLSEGGKIWPYVREVAEAVGLVPHLCELLTTARELELPVLFVPHRQYEPGDYEGWRHLSPSHRGTRTLQAFTRGSWGAQFHPDLQPRAGEVVVHEHWHHSGFANTDLDFHLRIRGLERVVIAGMRGNACVEGTARHAVELGYHVTLVKDATATFRAAELAATMDINAAVFAHAVSTTREVLAQLRAETPKQTG